MKNLLTFFLVFLLMGFSITAFATPIQWTVDSGGNDHWYEVIGSGDITWTDADAAAELLTWETLTGSLASITSEDENVFVSGLVNNYSTDNSYSYGSYGPWIGGFRDPSNTNWTTSGQWSDGSSWDYTNWDSGQPTNTGGDQYYVHYYPNNAKLSLTWNDTSNDGYGATHINAYVVEYAASSAPEPTTIVLFGFGLLSLAGINRRKRKKA